MGKGFLEKWRPHTLPENTHPELNAIKDGHQPEHRGNCRQGNSGVLRVSGLDASHLPGIAAAARISQSP